MHNLCLVDTIMRPQSGIRNWEAHSTFEKILEDATALWMNNPTPDNNSEFGYSYLPPIRAMEYSGIEGVPERWDLRIVLCLIHNARVFGTEIDDLARRS